MITIHRKRMCITIIRGVKFFPGMNTLSDAEMKIVAETKAFKSEIDCGNMVIGKQYDSSTSEAASSTDDIKIRAQKMVDEIASLTVVEAKEVIDEMADGYLLRAIKEKDGRKGIQEAVDHRMEEIKDQVGSDLTPENKSAPEGDGSDFDGNISGKKEDLDGNKGRSAIPALNKK